MNRTSIDMELNARARELEQWLESGDSMVLWGTLGWLTVGVIAFAIAIWLIGDLFAWAVQSWRHFLLSPFYLALVLIVAAAFWRVGLELGTLPPGVQRVTDALLGVN